MTKGIAILENWAVVGTGDIYTAPECRSRVLVGRVYGNSNPRFTDGKEIRTSRLVELDLKTRTASTLNTVYALGTPKPEYAKQFPAAVSENKEP